MPRLPASWDASDADARHEFVRLFRTLSEIAYADEESGRARLEQDHALAGSLHVGSGRLGMHAWSVPLEGDMVLAFRGSRSVASFVQDLRFIREQTREGGLHGGFAAGYESLHDSLVTRLRRSRARRVWLTGHSLGGALAVVAAGRLADAGHEIAGVVTFGQPRVCLADLAAVLGPRLRRRYLAWVNDGDVVPKLVLPYVHFGWRLSYDGADVHRRDLSGQPMLARGAAAGVRDDGDDGDGMDVAELDALIETLDGAAREASPAAGGAETPSGGDDRVVTGMIGDMFFAPHGLDRYADAVERWLTDPAPAREVRDGGLRR